MSRFNFYSVYDNRTDKPLIIDGSAEECAENMKIKVSSFYSLYSKCTNGYTGRWAIIKSDRYADITSKSTFGEKIKYHRRKQGLTIRELAIKVGFDETTISNYENDKTEPTLFKACCLADALGLSLDYLAGRKAEERNNV